MTEFHVARAFSREEPRIELIQSMLKSVLALVDLEFEGRPVQVDGFRLHNLEDWRTVREVSLQENLGSLSTACNCHCRFCYEDGNPEGLFERQPRFVSIDEAVTRQRYFHDGKGLFRESKGFFEPLANPQFLTLLELIREREPQRVIDVTTNGALLSPEVVARLADLKPVYANVSLISADEATRRSVMGDRRAGSAIRAIELLRASEIPFMGTLVPWPEQGLEDVEKTLEYLDANDARMIRVAMPGLTRHHPRYEPGMVEAWLPKVAELVSALRRRLRTPIIISPFAHVSTSIDAVVEGIIRRLAGGRGGHPAGRPHSGHRWEGGGVEGACRQLAQTGRQEGRRGCAGPARRTYDRGEAAGAPGRGRRLSLQAPRVPAPGLRGHEFRHVPAGRLSPAVREADSQRHSPETGEKHARRGVTVLPRPGRRPARGSPSAGRSRTRAPGARERVLRRQRERRATCGCWRISRAPWNATSSRARDPTFSCSPARSCLAGDETCAACRTRSSRPFLASTSRSCAASAS